MSPTRVNPATRSRARALRRNATLTERRLWHALKAVRVSGSHFRRQVPIGRYVADFACHRTKLIIEADGGQHIGLEVERYDEARSAWLATQGYRVLRFQNPDIIHNLEGVIAVIEEAILEMDAGAD